MKKTTLALAALLCLYSGNLKAQTTPEWSLTSGSTVSPPKWLKQFSTGILVMCDDIGGLSGIDPEQHKVVWTKPELKNVQADAVQDIPGAPLAIINYANTLNPFGRVIIVNTVDGTEVFDSKDEEVRMGDYYPLPAISSLLLEGTKNKRNFQMLIDFAASEKKWVVDKGEGAKSGVSAFFGKMNKAVKASFGSQKYPFIDAEGNIVLVDDHFLSRIDVKTGNVLWSNEYDKKIAHVKERDGKIYLGELHQENLHCVNLATGAEEWKKPLKLGGGFNDLVSYAGNEMIVLHSDGFNILDLNTLTFKWKKDPKVGDVTDIKILEKGFVTAHEEKDKAKLAFTNMDGKKVWDKDLDEALITYSITPKGVYYVTKERANVLSLEEGDKVWRRDIKIKGIPRYLVDQEANAVIMYTNDNLYKFDMNAADYKIIYEDIKLKDYVDKDADRTFGINGYNIDFNDHNDVVEIEKVDGKYLVRTNQNFWLIDAEGKVSYSKYYKEAGLSKGMRTFAQLASAGGAMYMVGSAYAGVGSAMTGTGNVDAARNGMIAGNVTSVGMRALATRITATQTTQYTVSVLAKFEDGTKGLVSLDKATGEEKARILFKDNTPIYVVDDVTNKLYLVTGTTMACYNLNSK